jgi:predicted RNA-binding Zn ribbon-like protein
MDINESEHSLGGRFGPIPKTVFRQPCLDFVNSEFTDYRTGADTYDRLDTSEWRRWLLDRWSYDAPTEVAPATLAKLRRLRKLMRRIVEEHRKPSGSEVKVFNRLLAASPRIWRLLPHRSAGTVSIAIQLRPRRRGWDSVIADLIVSMANLVSSNEIVRVKRCGNPNCNFLFYDESTDRRRRWCNASQCGNLHRVRAFRQKHRPKVGREGRRREGKYVT